MYTKNFELKPSLKAANADCVWKFQNFLGSPYRVTRVTISGLMGHRLLTDSYTKVIFKSARRLL